MDDRRSLADGFTAERRARLFSALRGFTRIGVAVSGGPDSTALLILLDIWARETSAAPAITVLTVDHGLRPEAATEARDVVALADRLGHAHEILVWRHDGPPPSSDIQAEARAARYRLITEAARRHRLDAVLLAHTRDDQAETFLINLARGSGVSGLSAMPARRDIDGIPFLRPLLDVSKVELLALLDEAGIAYVTDPSNSSDRYTRVRIRKAMPALYELGLTPDRLADTARRMGRAETALKAITADLIARSATDHGGVWSVDAKALAKAPDEIALRLLVELIRAIRPAEHPPRADAIESWHRSFIAAEVPRRATMAGVVIHVRQGRVWLYAEAGRSGFAEIEVGDGDHVWDGRWLVSIHGAGTRRFRLGPDDGGDGRLMPKDAARTRPAFNTIDGSPMPADVVIAARPLSATETDGG
jgi:tRNA(Ile)-lysidine synthase